MKVTAQDDLPVRTGERELAGHVKQRRLTELGAQPRTVSCFAPQRRLLVVGACGPLDGGAQDSSST